MPERLFVFERPMQLKPVKIRGLMQAVYVSECLCVGESEDEITDRFEGDRQLVEMWVSFVKHNGWVTFDTITQTWAKTLKGEKQAYNILKRVGK